MPNRLRGRCWIRLSSARSGAKLTKQADGSLLASGKCPPQDSYIIKTTATLGTITAIRLETLPDESLPHKGPGRTINGNFTLTEFTVSVAGQPVRIAQRKPTSRRTVTALGRLRQRLTVSQKLAGPLTRWKAQTTLPSSNWSGRFPTSQARRLSSGSITPVGNTASGDCGCLPHSRSRRFPCPRQKHVSLSGSVPSTKTAGFLAISDAFFVQSSPYWTSNCKLRFTIAGTLAGKPAAFDPVVNGGYYVAPWRTWRMLVAPSDTPQPFELPSPIHCRVPSNTVSPHFVPVQQRGE